MLGAGLALLAGVPAAAGADAPSPDGSAQAERLRGLERSLAGDRESALLQLYALESDLQAARDAVGALAARRSRLAAEQAATRRRLAVARTAAASSREQIGRLLRSLYERRGVDPLEVLLGSRSLEEALGDLESLDRAAAEQRRILGRSRATRARLVRLDARLTARRAELRGLAEAAEARARELEQYAVAKAAYVVSLRRRQNLTTQQVTALETTARDAQQQAAELRRPAPSPTAASVASAPVEPVVAADGARLLTVSALGYSLPGRTASGLPVGHGVVAVDPNVIPLGTRLYVPGYGAAVAADTGGAIRGAVIDLWFPTVAEARAWGRRTVVITLR